MSTTTTDGPAGHPELAPPARQAASVAAASSIGELVASISREASTLVRDEIALARTELRAEVRSGLTGAVMFAVAGMFGVLALFVLTAAFVVGVAAAGLGLGWSMLIVAGVYLLLAGLLALGGRRSLSRVGPPPRTVRTLRGVVDKLRSRRATQPGSAT
jgi:hypothetical protein